MKQIKFKFLFLALLTFTITSCESNDDSIMPQSQLPDDDMSDDDSDTNNLLFEIGDEGPAGGIVFYDKGFMSDGWRYLEVANTDLGHMDWGCFDTLIDGADETALGSGKANSEDIVNFHDSIGYYDNPEQCSDMNDGSVAAKACLNYIEGGFDDWYLPSSEESRFMYLNLHLEGLGNFNEDELYWSSSESINNTAFATDFSNGDQGLLCKQCQSVVIVRAIRQF